MSTREIVREWAGKLSAGEIAEMAGVQLQTVYQLASDMGLSLKHADPTPRDKRIYYASVPSGEEADFAKAVDAIIEQEGLGSQSAALIYAVRQADPRKKKKDDPHPPPGGPRV